MDRYTDGHDASKRNSTRSKNLITGPITNRHHDTDPQLMLLTSSFMFK